MMRQMSTLLVVGAAIVGIVFGGAFTASAAGTCQSGTENPACDNYSIIAGSQWT